MPNGSTKTCKLCYEMPMATKLVGGLRFFLQIWKHKTEVIFIFIWCLYKKLTRQDLVSNPKPLSDLSRNISSLIPIPTCLSRSVLNLVILLLVIASCATDRSLSHIKRRSWKIIVPFIG